VIAGTNSDYPCVPTFFFNSPLAEPVLNANHVHKHGHDSANLAIQFTLSQDFFKWLETQFTKHTVYQTRGYFNRHLRNRTFNSPTELYQYILSQERGIKNLTVTARVYLNFCDTFNKIPVEVIAIYRKVLKIKRSRKDFYVPKDSDVIANYKKVKSHKNLEIVYLVLATSGIRYIECLDFLRSFDKDNFSVQNNYVSYNVSELRHTKNINNIYLPLFVFHKLRIVTNTYNALRQRYKEKDVSFTLKYLRKWHYNFLLYNTVPESVADFIQGRTSKSVSANHYLAKAQQASFWYEKVADKFKELFV